MCRLALMNRAAIMLLGTAQLAALFADLEMSLGGHGNGLAALWSQSRRVKIHKGLHFTTAQAAAKAVAYAGQEADWILFHTRFATSGQRISRHCHPFQRGPLVLAHNGHSSEWDTLGRSIGICDSECITHVWAHLRLPLTLLEEEGGIFLGFHSGRPFVVKGSSFSDLTVSFHKKTGAILFASVLAESLRSLFDHTVEAGRFLWFGEPFDIWKVEIRRPQPRYPTSTPTRSFSPLADLRAWYRRQEQEAVGKSSSDEAKSDYSPHA